MRRRINVDDGMLVRAFRARIKEHFGEESAIAFLEAIANVREHCPNKQCSVCIGPCGWKLTDHGMGVGSGRTGKPRAVQGFREGGYGLPMILALGGRIISGPRGTTILWCLSNCPVPSISARHQTDCGAR